MIYFLYKNRDPPNISSECVALIRRFLKVNPNGRPDLHELILEPNSWLNIGYEHDKLQPYIEPHLEPKPHPETQ